MCFVHAIDLDVQNPAGFDDFCILRLRDEGPCLVLHDRIQFFLHG